MLPPFSVGGMVLRAGPLGATPQLAAERGRRDAHARQELGMTVTDARDAQRRIREVVGEKAEAGDRGRPPPIRGGHLEQLDLERVTRSRASDGDGPRDLVDP